MDKKQVKQVAGTVAKQQVKQHERKLHKMAAGGTVTRGNGAAIKGTKARGPMA